MKRVEIEHAYHELIKLTDDGITKFSYVIGIYQAKDRLAPGIQIIVTDEIANHPVVDTQVIIWNTDKQLTLKQLSKIVNIWHELDKSA